MSNNITIELCAEDRARLDKIVDRLGKFIPPTVSFDPVAIFTPLSNGALIETPETPQEAPNAETEKSIEPTEKEAPSPVSAESAPPWEDSPSVTLDQIQKKVVQLAAGYNGSKKAKVRAIINDYGTKVSDLKDKPEKWAEIWERLNALESEG